MEKIITAPWTPDQVKALNEYQQGGWMHPFTCGGNNRDANHLDGEGMLVATIYGWVCPYCDYEQDWAHLFMTEPAPPWHRPGKSIHAEPEGTRRSASDD